MNSQSSTDRDPLEALMEEFAARCRSNENPDLEQYVRQLPDREDEIRELFPTVALMERMKRKTDSESAAASAPSPMSGAMPKQIGSYQILREIGRGGMGVVFQAVQDGLERQVALKVMNANAISSEAQLRRFRREVRSAARLHHTNIVPVFAVGEDNGTYYYSMQYIDGMSLDQYIGSIRANSEKSGDPPPTTLFTDSRALTRDVNLAATGSIDVSAMDNIADRNERSMKNSLVGTEHADTDFVLDEKIQKDQWQFESQGPDYWRRVASIGQQIADALQWAHQHNVLHRDIKPQNLLIDRAGNVWVTDFGLAKILNEGSASKTGNIVGTLSYMSPEQLRGKASEASDVYSLGLTLYEMLTLKPAFGRKGTSTSIADRVKVKELDPIRSINRQVPRDLETIVMKAVRHDPEDRYSSAEGLRADLENYLDGQPIAARRSTVVERLWKWSWRNPALAAVLSLLFVVLATSAFLAHRGRLKVDSLLTESQQAERLAGRRLDLVMNAFDDLLKTYSEQSVRTDDVFGLEPSRLIDAPVTLADTQRLERMVNFYQQFATDEDNPELNLNIVTAMGTLGDIYLRLGRLEEAESAYRNTVAWIESRSGIHAELILARARMFNELGRVALQQGKIPETLSNHLEARATLMDEGADFLVSPDFRFELARASNLVSSMLIRMRIIFQRPVRRQSTAADDPEPTQINSIFSQITPRQQKYFVETEEQLSTQSLRLRLFELSREAQDELGKLSNQFPDNTGYRLAFARSMRYFAVMAWIQNSVLRSRISRSALPRPVISTRGAESFQKSVALLKELRAENPDKPLFAFELANCQTDSGKFVDPQIALEELFLAIETCDELIARFPTTFEYELVRSLAIRELAYVNLGLDEIDLAARYYEDSIARMDELIERVPEQASLRMQTAQTRFQLVLLLDVHEFDSTIDRVGILDDALNLLEYDEKEFQADPMRDQIYSTIRAYRDNLGFPGS